MIGDIELRHLRRRFAQRVGEQCALPPDHILQDTAPRRRRRHALHRSIMQAAQADRVERLLPPGLGHQLAPIVEDRLWPSGEVERAPLPLVPFAQIVAEHRLGVRTADDDAIAPGERRVARITKEGRRNGVHRRPQRIGLQPPHQFEDTLIGLRPDIALFRVEGLGRPGLEPPILVVQEDAAILHRRRARDEGPVGDDNPVATTRRDIRPPFPGRHAQRTRKVGHAISRTPCIRSGNQQITPTGHADPGPDIAFPAARDRRQVHPALPRQPLHHRRGDRPDDDAHIDAVRPIRDDRPRPPAQRGQIAGQQFGGDTGRPLAIGDRQQACVRQVQIGGLNGGGDPQHRCKAGTQPHDPRPHRPSATMTVGSNLTRPTKL